MSAFVRAVMAGLWLVGLGVVATPSADAQCAFAHGQNTGNNGWSRLVQAYVPCNGYDCDGMGGLVANANTSGGTPSCTPPLTYHQFLGSPANGWVLDPVTGRARVRFDQLASNDVGIRLQLRDVRDVGGNFPPVGATGQLYVVFRLTFDDPMFGDMTMIDTPLLIPVAIANTTGDANVSTTYNTLAATLALPILTACASFEVIEVTLLDPAYSKFLRLGHFRL